MVKCSPVISSGGKGLTSQLLKTSTATTKTVIVAWHAL